DDNINLFAREMSIAIGADGNPVIAFVDDQDPGNDSLKVARCTTPACATADVTTLDDAGDTGYWPSIAVGDDGLPVISYYSATLGDLLLARCDTPLCADATLTTMDSAGDVGQYTSIAIGDDGIPVISYQDVLNAHLKVVRCATAECAAPAAPHTVD